MSINNLITQVMAELLASANNDYKDNYDYNRFGKLDLPQAKRNVKGMIVKKLNDRGFFNDYSIQNLSKQIKNSVYPFSDFFYLYELLADEYSKELLGKLIAYHILGHTKVKLPLSTNEFWHNQELIEANQSKNDFISIESMNIKLPLTNLEFLNVPLKMYYSSLGVNIDFIIKQYEFNRGGIIIKAEPGDVVIDGGGCFGDTALYFAQLVGEKGQVKSFEFIPQNIEIFEKNLELNPKVAPVVEIVKNPMWDISDKEVFYQDKGPSSRVSLEHFEGYTGKTSTLSIDNFVDRTQLGKVDFIKMDIEGAETNALLGAVNTIKKFRPKLAIALYHSTKDFESIPKFINELNLGYKFYLLHATIYGEETMLFASTTTK